ncbi:PREDICTED: transcription factor RF2a-like [Camelina sativa]|uniref:Transcription factor RF2a-like n=1 Tax=Camelina sativa TaxID=90675 RepID=A0ABM0U758_CAMSA|nr:PREDICTED: transcription factor RF2a-like [Camelina sativa]
MGDTEKCSNTTDHMIHRLHSSLGTSSSSIPKHASSPIHQQQLDLNPNFLRSSTTTTPQFSNCAKRIGVPPSHPNLIPPPTSPFSQIPTSRQQPSSLHSHSRSLSQPNSFFSFDSLPPLSPSPFRDSLSSAAQLPDHDVSMEDPDSAAFSSPFTRCNNSTSSVRPGESLPPRKSHRRSSSDIPTGFNNSLPPRPLERSFSGGECADWSKSAPFVKKESSCEREGVGDREAMDDLFSAYMNLENIDVLNSSEAEDSKNGGGTNNNENRDDMESSRASGNKTNNGSSDTEGESSSVNESANTGVKRRAAGGDIAPTTRHYRSVSVDSCFMDKFSFGEESLKPPLSPGTISRKVSPTNSVDGNSGAAAAAFSIEFKNGEFTAAELKKIMANDKLAEMAMSDPKRVKRILANRQSAARSKERKMRYIVELEHKVQTLQTEATTLSAQLTLLQRDMIGLTNQNNELKFRLQAMEQQARLRDALNEALNGEVQRLKLAIGETSHNESERSKMQSLNAEMFQQLNISQLRQQPQQSQQNQNGTMALATKPESNE